MDAERRVRFGGFDFDPDTGEVTRDGVPAARLQGQPSQVLDALISGAGRLVTRDELHRLLWPENSLVDADNGLNIAINKIRLALDDSASQPRFIQTVPRRGYRFIAAIEHVQKSTVPAARANGETAGASFRTASAENLPVRPPRRARLAGTAIAGLLTLSSVVVVAWGVRARPAAIRSAAVMPIANLAADPELDYAVQGLTETLATELPARGLARVIATEATAQYRGSNVPPGQVARELNVDAIIVGSVVRHGASFAVNLRLIDGRTQRSLWARRFVRATPMELTLTDDVLADLAPALGLTTTTRRLDVAPTPVLAAARDEYLRGRYFWNMRTERGMDAAVAHLTRAIEIDRRYALAWAGLADVYAIGGQAPSAVFTPWPGSLEAGLRSAEEALRLDRSLGEARAALGKLRMAQGRWSDAERELSAAVGLSPSYATARQWYGTLLSRLQKCPAASEQAEIGRLIDPVTPIVNEAVGTTLAACGQPERAVPIYRMVLEMHPGFASTHMRLAGAYLRMGDAASALAEYREAVRLRPNNCEFKARMVRALHAVGNLDEARAIGTRVIADAAAGRASQYCAALAHVNLGDFDRAIAALDREITAQGGGGGLLADFHLRPLHSDPRWRGLLDRAGLTPYARTASR